MSSTRRPRSTRCSIVRGREARGSSTDGRWTRWSEPVRGTSAENRARVVDYVRRTLPGLVPEPYAETTCIFTNTPDADFVIDGVDGLVVASPCSGHGAKFAPLLGRIIADTALGTPVPAKLRVA
ncbi:FAD-dependent oxidoreductase [Kribbella sp. NPDC055110]